MSPVPCFLVDFYYISGVYVLAFSWYDDLFLPDALYFILWPTFAWWHVLTIFQTLFVWEVTSDLPALWWCPNIYLITYLNLWPMCDHVVCFLLLFGLGVKMFLFSANFLFFTKNCSTECSWDFGMSRGVLHFSDLLWSSLLANKSWILINMHAY